MLWCTTLLSPLSAAVERLFSAGTEILMAGGEIFGVSDSDQKPVKISRCEKIASGDDSLKKLMFIDSIVGIPI